MQFIDLFSGIGAFRKGFELCGMTCAGHCEIDKYADRSYRAIHDVKECEWYARDIKEVTSEEIPYADLWSAGFPCQDISVAGRQSGLAGERSSLFFEIVRLIKGKSPEDRPRWLVLENVRNLLSVHGGWDFATVLGEVAALGYDIQYGLLNSKDFGVPQNRQRVFIVACRHSRGKSSREIFPVQCGDGKALMALIGGTQGSRVYDPRGVSTTLTAEGGGAGAKTGLYAICENAECTLERGARAVLTPERSEKRQNGRRIKEIGEPAFCLTAQDRHGVMVSNCKNCQRPFQVKSGVKSGFEMAMPEDCINLAFPDSKTRRGRVGHGVAQTLDTSCNQGVVTACFRIRRLTPRECFRLQGFSDESYEKAALVNSETQLYKQAGNSVTIPVVVAIGQKIMAA